MVLTTHPKERKKPMTKCTAETTKTNKKPLSKKLTNGVCMCVGKAVITTTYYYYILLLHIDTLRIMNYSRPLKHSCFIALCKHSHCMLLEKL